MTLYNGKRLGFVEIGSYAVRRMVATFQPNGSFWLDGSKSYEYVHGIDVDSVDETKVAALWKVVQDLYKSLLDLELPAKDVWVYGTELCRRLSKRQRLPTYVLVLSAEREAVMSWATGFLKVFRTGVDGWMYTVFDQGGGSSELVSGIWSAKRNKIDNLEYATFDIGHIKLGKLYSSLSTPLYVREVQGVLELHAEQIALHTAKGRTSSLILLGGPATKLAFNIKHKRDDNHDYDGRAVDVTTLTVNDIQSYYNKIAKLHKTDPDRARYKVDRRTVKTDEYERIMSGAILLMLISARLGYQKLTVTASSTRYGFGFLAARGLIENKSEPR